MINFLCPQCGKANTVQDDLAGTMATCTACGASVLVPPATQPAGEAPSGPVRDGPAFEREPEVNVNSFIATCKAVITDPVATFATLRTEGGFGRPVIFALICGVIGGIGAGFWMLVRNGAGHACGQFITVPISAVLGVFIGGGILHLMLMLLGARKRDYEATARVVAYSAVPLVLHVVPIVGPMIGGIWMIVLHIIGLRAVHETTTGKAVAAVLIPIGILCACAVVFVIAIGGAALAIFSQQQGGMHFGR